MTDDEPNASLRVAAEGKLPGGAKDAPSATARDALVHELQVHQIELEMQNEALRQSQVALEAARDRYLDLYEFAPVGYLTLTPSGQISEVNLTAASMLGVERKALLRSRFDMKLCTGDRARWQHAFLAAKQSDGRAGCDVALALPDGSTGAEVHVDVVGTAADDGSTSLRVTLTDVSESKRVEQKLIEARNQAEMASRAKTAFLANMSHEIRTPLNVVLGLAQYLEALDVTEAERQEVAGNIRVAGVALLRTLNDILDLSKIEAGQLDIDRYPFRLRDVLARIENLVEVGARSKGLTLRIASNGYADWWLVGDSMRVEQILLNLLGNAIKFTSQGEIRIEVRQRASDATAVRLRFDVVDRGIGMPVETAAALFKPFMQADVGIARRYGGTGLGLSICKRLVELMGGAIGVESAEGAGSTFWFELSFDRASEDDVRTVTLAEAPTALPVGKRLAGARLLVVDDSRLNQYLFRRIFEREGAVVEVAGNGLEALDVLAREPEGFSAVLMDTQMPELDGLEATRRLRRDPALASLPVIACSAGVYSEDRAKVRACGANGFVVKPVDIEQLVTTMAHWALPNVLPSRAAPTAATRAMPETAKAPLAKPDDWPGIAGIDRVQAEQVVGADSEFFLHLLGEFVVDFRELPALIEADLIRGDREGAVARLHKFRGSAGNLGATDAAQAARCLEDALYAKSPEVPRLQAEFNARFAALLQASLPWLG